MIAGIYSNVSPWTPPASQTAGQQGKALGVYNDGNIIEGSEGQWCMELEVLPASSVFNHIKSALPITPVLTHPYQRQVKLHLDS